MRAGTRVQARERENVCFGGLCELRREICLGPPKTCRDNGQPHPKRLRGREAQDQHLGSGSKESAEKGGAGASKSGIPHPSPQEACT